MPAQRYSQYFNISDKYYAVVTKKLIDEGKVKWDAFYPHETFIQLLHQVVSMLSGKENQSIWVEGTYGTGKSHAALTLKCLLEAPEEAVHDYFKDYGLSDDLCSKFLAARSEEMNGKLIVVHRIGSSNIKNDDDLVWAVQDSVSRALRDAGVQNMAAGTMKEAWISELSDEDISELFHTMDTGVFCDASDKFFQTVEARVNAYKDAQRSKRLGKLWHDKTETNSPADWSRRFSTPILCMFDDNERQKAKEVFSILHKSKPTEAEYATAETWLKAGNFYDRLSSAVERDQCMKERLVGDFAYLLPDVNKVRDYLRDRASMITPYEWMDNSTIVARIREMADMRYKTGGASDAEKAVADLDINELRDYVRDLIKTDMSVGIAILKRQKH